MPSIRHDTERMIVAMAHKFLKALIVKVIFAAILERDQLTESASRGVNWPPLQCLCLPPALRTLDSDEGLIPTYIKLATPYLRLGSSRYDLGRYDEEMTSYIPRQPNHLQVPA